MTASISGPLDVVDEPGGRAIWESIGYMRDQGYGTGVTHEAEWRGRNPKDVASNLSHIDHEVFSSTGDACLALSSLQHPDCRRLSPVTNPAAAAVEAVLARQYGLFARELPKAGVRETRAQLPGVHGANNHRVYAENVVPMANKIFARGVSEPTRFRYRTTAPSFSVWGFDVSLDRDGAGFLDMADVATSGRTFQLRGAGTVTVRTPANFEPGRSYQVTATADDGKTSKDSVVADKNGRLPIVVDLGRSTLVDKVLQPTGLRSQRSVTVSVR